MMYNKNICFKPFQLKSHILILIQQFKGFKEAYAYSDSSYLSQRGALQAALGAPGQALGRDLQPSTAALGKRSHSGDTVRTSCGNHAKGIRRDVRDQYL